MIRLESKPDVTPPATPYPYGRIKDRVGAVPGTPVTEEVYGDFHQFFEKLMALAGVTGNDLPDNDTNGYQLMEAFIKAGSLSFAADIIKGILGSYTTNDLIILYGCKITATIPGSSTITAGAIFYNDVVYKVSAATVVTSGSEILVFKIDSTVQPGLIYLTHGLNGTGIANYNQSSVKNLQDKYKAEISIPVTGSSYINAIDTDTPFTLNDAAGTDLLLVLPNDGFTRDLLIVANAAYENGPGNVSLPKTIITDGTTTFKQSVVDIRSDQKDQTITTVQTLVCSGQTIYLKCRSNDASTEDTFSFNGGSIVIVELNRHAH
jgi:hypothetical protein